jgi:integrase
MRFALHVTPVLGPIQVDELTSDDIEGWQRRLVKGDSDEARRKSQNTANRVLTSLKAALNLAFRKGKVESDKQWRMVRPYKGVDFVRERYLSMAECERLLNACDPDFRVLVRGALETGCRYGELTRMKVADFNPDAGVIGVGKTKSGKSKHVVLTEDGVEFFASLTAGRLGDELMFGREWKPGNQFYALNEALKRAKITPPITFHGLRHTWASHAVMNGVPLTVVAKNLGHVNTRYTEKHYGHLADDFLKKQVRQFAPKFGAVDSKIESLR